MTRFPLLDDVMLVAGLDALSAADRRFAAARAQWGDPTLRRWPAGFETLVDIILGQQVSGASADAIKAKLRAAINPLTPAALRAASEETLRACGLSRQKLVYVRDLAEHVLDGRLMIDALPDLPEDEVIGQLTAVKGIGLWTAEIYLLFALGRPDVWPADDLAIAIGAQHLMGLPERPKTKELRALAENWRPWRGVAAHMLWRYYPHLVAAAKARMPAA